MTELMNIRILTSIRTNGVNLDVGQRVKAYVYENNIARLYSQPNVYLSGSDFELVISESEYEKLLNQV